MMPDRVQVFAPATVANLGPGYDVLGLAVDGLGDWVWAERCDGPPGVELVGVGGDNGQLPTEVTRNTASVAALSAARRLGVRARITLEKGLPLCSGLGSSAASSVAGAAAIAALAGVELATDRAGLLIDALAGEAVASGSPHADNAAPCLIGGAVLITNPDAHPPEWVSLPVPDSLWVALAIPELELPTKAARAALPKRIALHEGVMGWARVGGLVASLYRGDLDLLASCLHDDIVEPVRGALIRGFDAVKSAALAAGALAASISGAGPTLFALCSSRDAAMDVAAAMVATWEQAGVTSRAHVSQPDQRGVRTL